MRFDLDPATSALSYKLLASTVTPRPIAWVTTISNAGVLNAAPYSFFNVMGSVPPTVAIGIMAAPGRGFKDTARNVLETGEFVINLVPEGLAEAMNLTCMDAPPEESELDIAGLEPAPAAHVRPPRIAASPVALECVTLSSVNVSAEQLIVIGKVLAIHVDDPFLLDVERGHVDTPRLGLIGRMHGAGWYTRTADLFQIDRPDYRTWKRAASPPDRQAEGAGQQPEKKQEPLP
jgi:flavin reductase (DIM6/NTAB) family NADH-FMN oxidoreductase RutF